MVFFQNYSWAPVSIPYASLDFPLLVMLLPSSWPPEAQTQSSSIPPASPLSIGHQFLLSLFPFGQWPSFPILMLSFAFRRYLTQMEALTSTLVITAFSLVSCGLQLRVPFFIMAFKPFYCHSLFEHSALAKPTHSQSLAFSKYEPWGLWICHIFQSSRSRDKSQNHAVFAVWMKQDQPVEFHPGALPFALQLSGRSPFCIIPLLFSCVLYHGQVWDGW